MGGLGNQLFIYASGLQLATQHHVPLVIHTDWYSTNRDRELGLAAFQFTGELKASTEPFDRQIRSRSMPLPLRKRVAAREGISLVVEGSHAFTPIPTDLEPPIELRGYFQSWRYFTGIQDLLASQLTELVNVAPAVQVLSQQLADMDPWIAVHVRCGDFLDPALGGLIGKMRVDYYERAIALIEQAHGRRPLVVFSDDPDCAKGLLRDLRDDMHFVDLDKSIRPMDWLNLISQATSVVTANSSFSWWGAWLAQQRGAWPIVCPRPWFGDRSLPERDLLPLSWITVGREYRA